MNALDRWRRLLRQPAFARLVGVRVLTQGADATIQVGMASYLLFNPQNQPNAWAIAAVIALVMLPFSVVGPFVSPILDRFARQRIVIVCDALRLALVAGMAVLVGESLVSGGWQIWLYVLLLAALSLNRLQLAALGAGMPFTVDVDQYLDAASVSPMIGPLSAVFGGLLAGAIRLGSGRVVAPAIADALVFGLAAALFAVAIWLMRGFGREQLGPRERSTGLAWGVVWSGFSGAARQLRERPVAAVSIAMVFGAKAGYGTLMTAIILLYRHHFHSPAELEVAMLGMGAWFLASGLGYSASGLVALPASGRLGVRATVLGALLIASLLHFFPASLLNRPALLVAGVGLGLCVQSVKICADTVVQAHVADAARGRVMVVYDIFNNLGVVVGAVVGAFVLPADGHSLAVMIGLGVWYGLLAGIFALTSRAWVAAFDRGTARQPDADHGLE